MPNPDYKDDEEADYILEGIHRLANKTYSTSMVTDEDILNELGVVLNINPEGFRNIPITTYIID